MKLTVTRCISADKGNKEEVLHTSEYSSGEIYFRVEVMPGAICHFSFSADGENYTPAGKTFTAKQGKWIGAKIGLFALREGFINDAGTVDVDWFRIGK